MVLDESYHRQVDDCVRLFDNRNTDLLRHEEGSGKPVLDTVTVQRQGVRRRADLQTSYAHRVLGDGSGLFEAIEPVDGELN